MKHISIAQHTPIHYYLLLPRKWIVPLTLQYCKILICCVFVGPIGLLCHFFLIFALWNRLLMYNIAIITYYIPECNVDLDRLYPRLGSSWGWPIPVWPRQPGGEGKLSSCSVQRVTWSCERLLIILGCCSCSSMIFQTENVAIYTEASNFCSLCSPKCTMKCLCRLRVERMEWRRGTRLSYTMCHTVLLQQKSFISYLHLYIISNNLYTDYFR